MLILGDGKFVGRRKSFNLVLTCHQTCQIVTRHPMVLSYAPESSFAATIEPSRSLKHVLRAGIIVILNNNALRIGTGHTTAIYDARYAQSLVTLVCPPHFWLALVHNS